MEKLVDAQHPEKPLPAWRWLFWWVPDHPNRPTDKPADEYLVGGSDDPATADEMRERNYIVRENPVWRTLN